MSAAESACEEFVFGEDATDEQRGAVDAILVESEALALDFEAETAILRTEPVKFCDFLATVNDYKASFTGPGYVDIHFIVPEYTVNAVVAIGQAAAYGTVLFIVKSVGIVWEKN